MENVANKSAKFDYRSSHVAVYVLVSESLRLKGCVEVSELRALAESEQMDTLLLGWQMAHVGLTLVRDGARLFLVERSQRTVDEKLRWVGPPDPQPGLGKYHDYRRDGIALDKMSKDRP